MQRYRYRRVKRNSWITLCRGGIIVLLARKLVGHVKRLLRIRLFTQPHFILKNVTNSSIISALPLLSADSPCVSNFLMIVSMIVVLGAT